MIPAHPAPWEGWSGRRRQRRALTEYRARVQMIFQVPYASLNPRFKVQTVLEEPLAIHRRRWSERQVLIDRALTEVKLTPVEEFRGRFPHMLSGGQRQRVATARTLMLSPSLLVADEPVSMIDLSTARYFTDRLAVMYLGRIVEVGTPGQLIDAPAHPYSRAPIAAVCEPVAGRVRVMREVPIRGEIPSAADIPAGCRFHPRCLFATSACRELPEPELEEVGAGKQVGPQGQSAERHLAACRRWREI